MALNSYDLDSIRQAAQFAGQLADRYTSFLNIFKEWAPDDALLETITQQELDAVFGEDVIDVVALKDCVYWMNTVLLPALQADNNALLTKMQHIRRAQ